MSAIRLLKTFRVRLLAVLALLLIATLGVQFYLNLRESQRVAVTIARQEQALAASVALGLESIPTANKYLVELDREHKIPLRQEHPSVMNVLIVREDGRVDDSLDPTYKPQRIDGSDVYYNISDVPLPPRLVDVGHDMDEVRRLIPTPQPNRPPVPGERRAVPIRVKTVDSEGNVSINYIIVVLGSQPGDPGSGSRSRIISQLLPTLAIILLAIIATTILVWRFTRPIQELTSAARRVAAGNFSQRVHSAARGDEMGEFSRVFNEMLA